MHRSALTRTFAAFLSLWFLLVMIEPEAVHSCPVHDGAVAGASHATHSMHHTGATHSHQAHKAICSCPGDCSAPASAALPGHAAPVIVASYRVVTRSLIHTSVAPKAKAQTLLPPAIGPPASRG